MIYLACPYSDPDPMVREARYRAACRATAMLVRDGNVVFSPVVHSHPLVACGLPTRWDFWEPIDRAFLERCDELVVLPLHGWEASAGVKAEIAMAEELNRPVRVLDAVLGSLTLARVGRTEAP